MGMYLNPGNEGFQQALNGIYVDKTEMIVQMNSALNTNSKLICMSRPRRFGKTTAAHMLCAYYDKSCDSRNMFEKLQIANSPDYEQHLNQYNVIFLDITWFLSQTNMLEEIVTNIQKWIIEELRDVYKDCIADDTNTLAKALSQINVKTEERFFFIIDEWDALFREAKYDVAIQKEYIQFLRGLFKAGPSSVKNIVGAYMTGILPIKKYGTESALTDFREYTMVKPAKFAKYVGFTEEEVRMLCDENGMDFDLMKQWYDGYSFSKMEHIYSPNSVMNAIHNEEFGNYWTSTESFESLKDYISMNVDGLKDAIISMIGGFRIKNNPLKFQNDLTSLHMQDQIITLLVHLGYLAYDEKQNEVYIPNLEVAEVFKAAVEESGWSGMETILKASDTLLMKTLEQDTEYIVQALEQYHEQTTSVIKYNDENSLACAITIAYYTAQKDYTIIRELPTGKGYADLVFVPRRHTDKPAMVVELKYNRSADTAIAQIKEKRYTGALKDYKDKILLVEISYDKDSKEHSCVIEEWSDVQDE